MSTDVDFFCVNCGKDGGFDNANRQYRSFFQLLHHQRTGHPGYVPSGEQKNYNRIKRDKAQAAQWAAHP